MEDRRYNPLSVGELGRNAARAIRNWNPVDLPPERFEGEGVYAIYYSGPFPAYAGMDREQPIYVGQAVITNTTARPLHQRLGEHANSIREAENLDLDDFRCRWLVLDSVWINLTEQLLIAEHRPVWNLVVLGFGSHGQGGNRETQKRSRWDTLHPGRPWADRVKHDNDLSADDLRREIAAHRASERTPGL